MDENPGPKEFEEEADRVAKILRSHGIAHETISWTNGNYSVIVTGDKGRKERWRWSYGGKYLSIEILTIVETSK